MNPTIEYRCDALIVPRPRSIGSVLIRELPLEYVTHPPTWPEVHPSCFDGPDSAASTQGRGIENALVNVEGGTVTLGKPKEFPRCVPNGGR